ncbi:receptor-like protein EIX2 [Humulus lupulus]|uniref:receptor-like protein EIX2 n=1 Tax=Humulus lupulus TaxID=3486 RepID=UPI002B40621F|nr:receptor-like protein EIX2 [Humulus lupulus]
MAALSVSMNHVTATIIFFVFLAQISVMVNVYFANGDQSNILCHETEKQALLSFKRDLVDDFNKLVSWDVSEEEDCCKWAGISCNTQTGHVSALSLSNGSFTGKINPSLLNLTHLLSLDLSLNHFSQIIPSLMGSLVSLRYLNFTHGGFQGKIPHQLGNLSGLHYLVLEDIINYYENGWSSNLLYVDNLHWVSGLSSLKSLVMYEVDLSKASDHWLFAINTLPSLQEVRLGFCDLGHIHFPSHINLTSLETLDLSDNSLELGGPIPCTIRNNMSLLKHLDLSGNNINSVIPKCFYSFPNLALLHLRGNKLQGTISSDVVNLTSIVSFDLSSNALTGSIPKSMGKLCNLEAIDLSYNRYKGRVSMVFESLLSGCLVKKRKSLHLDGNLFDSFTGEISDEIGVFENLVHLSLIHNNFFGPIPMSICQNLRSIESLDISKNNFSGSIPECLVSLSKLKSLIISYNQLSGPLPQSLWSLSNLLSLDISNNQLSGPLPQSLWSLSNLLSLDISNNQLSGPLPKCLGSLSNLDSLNIASNNFEGDVSEVHFANLTNLRIIHASGNKLTLNVSSCWSPPFSLYAVELNNWNLGPHFPIWLKSQKSISQISMSNTGISDVIPCWLWNISSSIDLFIDLSENQIYGEIPEFPNDRSYMLNLSSNKLTGPLPRIPVSISLDLSNNSLSGNISNFLCDRKSRTRDVEGLNLANNFLSGKIPDCWMYWPSLISIDLDNNNLTGKIPSSIGSLQNLRSLHLRNNSFTGEIPKALKNCSALIGLDLGFNKLVGTIPRWIESLPILGLLVLRSNDLTGLIPVELCKLSTLQLLDANMAIKNLERMQILLLKEGKTSTTPSYIS